MRSYEALIQKAVNDGTIGPSDAISITNTRGNTGC